MSLRRKVQRRGSIFQSILMNEGRKSQIVLLDERRLDFLIQPKLFAGDLLDLVASHFKLKEKQYFGLAFIDESSHYHWLQTDKRVLDHDFLRKSGLLLLHFSIRFYVDTIGLLRDIQTVELFYFNARQAIFKGHIECDSETVFELAAHVLQASKGDVNSDEEAKDDIKKLPIIPTRTLKEHPSISYCEDKVIGYYKKLLGTSRGLAIVNYMTIVEKLPTYGIHYYEVKDKKEIPWWLGISPKGIAVYDKNDKTTPRRVFTWKNLENLYYRDKKFSIEVHDPKRIVHTLSSFNLYEDAIREPLEHFDDLSDAITDPTTQVSVSRRTFGTSSVNVHTWVAGSAQLTKCIWSMAVAQHQFYLDRKQSKGMLGSARSMSEIAADLCRSCTSLVGSDLSRNSSSQSLPSLAGSRFELNTENLEAQKAGREMFQALKARKEALEETLRKKVEELKIFCFQEGELTGHLPKETPLEPGERVPTFRRRVGTSFAICPKPADSDEAENALASLELEYELQCKITAAAHRLAQDKSTSKYVRKQRRSSYNKAAVKLKDMERKLIEARASAGPQPDLGGEPSSAEDGAIPAGESTPHQHWDSSAGGQLERSAALPPQPPPYHHHHHHHPHHPQHVYQQQQQQQQQPPLSALTSPTHQHLPLSPSHSSPQLSTQGYQPSSVYDTRTQYRAQMYPTLSSSSSRTTMSPTSSLSPASVRSLQEEVGGGSAGSSSNNLYNVTLQQTSRYESTDTLQTPPTQSSADPPDHPSLHLPSKHGSLDRAYKRGDNSYGSLDRKQRRPRERPQGYSVEGGGGGGGREGSRDRGGPILHLDIRTTYAPGGYRGEGEDLPPPAPPPPPPQQQAVELPVYHERSGELGGWGDAASSRSPMYARGYDSYSPRLTETAHPPSRLAWGGEEGGGGGGWAGDSRVGGVPIPVQHYSQQAPPQSPQPTQALPHSYSGAVPVPVLHLDPQPEGGSPWPPSPIPPPPAQSRLVTVTRLQPQVEVVKPYQTSDFLRYSERLRKQRILDSYQRQLIGGLLDRSATSTPSSDSDSHHSLHSSHSSHSSSSLSHPLRLAAASAAYFAASGSPGRSAPPDSSPGTRGVVSGLPPMHPHYHRQDSDQGSGRGDLPDYGGVRGGGEAAPYSGVVSSSSEFQTVRSQGPATQVAQSQAQCQAYRASFMQAVASARHSHYQPPTPMTCRPVTSQAQFKGNQQGK